MRVTVVGSGFVGQSTAMRLLERGLAEVVLIDIIEGLPQALALDMKQSAPVVATPDQASTCGTRLRACPAWPVGSLISRARAADRVGRPAIRRHDQLPEMTSEVPASGSGMAGCSTRPHHSRSCRVVAR
jgi:hypothetical protein